MQILEVRKTLSDDFKSKSKSEQEKELKTIFGKELHWEIEGNHAYKKNRLPKINAGLSHYKFRLIIWKQKGNRDKSVYRDRIGNVVIVDAYHPDPEKGKPVVKVDIYPASDNKAVKLVKTGKPYREDKENFIEGGPGSGVQYRNTAPINLPKSEYVSVGTRKSMLANMDYDEYEIPLSSITKVAQKSYCPGKVTRMMKDREAISKKPVDVLWVRGDGYHMVDGHHRYLAASSLNMETLPARIYKKSEKTMPDYVADNPDNRDDLERATRTTSDADNPGKIDFMQIAAQALEDEDWESATDYFTKAMGV